MFNEFLRGRQREGRNQSAWKIRSRELGEDKHLQFKQKRMSVSARGSFHMSRKRKESRSGEAYHTRDNGVGLGRHLGWGNGQKGIIRTTH